LQDLGKKNQHFKR